MDEFSNLPPSEQLRLRTEFLRENPQLAGSSGPALMIDPALMLSGFPQEGGGFSSYSSGKLAGYFFIVFMRFKSFGSYLSSFSMTLISNILTNL